MAQVPYTPVPSVSPNESASIPYQSSAAATPAAFGAPQGEALQGLGKEVGHFGDVLAKHAMQIQHENNMAWANEAFVNSTVSAGELKTQLETQEGINAANFYKDKYVPGIRKIADDMAKSAPNPDAKTMFERDFRRRMGYDIENGAGFAGKQMRQYQKNAAAAVTSTAIKDAAAAPDNEKQFQNGIALIKQSSAEQTKGWSPEAATEFERTQVSAAWATRIEAIAQTDPFKAKALYDRNKEGIDGVTQVKIEKHLMQQYNAVGTRIFADDIAKGRVDYYSNLRTAESGGDDTAQSKTSSAAGRYQFTKGTWEDLMKRHPELELTPGGRFDRVDQQERAVKVFTQENATALKEGGYEASQKNLYLAHFLGAGGANKFLAGLKANPDAPAASLVEDGVAAANASIFQDKDGKVRTAQQVYDRLTGKFGGAPLTTESETGWLANAIEQAKDLAKQYAPDNPEFEDTLIRRVKNEYVNVKTIKAEAETANFNTVQGAVLGMTGGQPIKTLDGIYTNAALNQAFHSLPSGRQKQIASQVERNAKADVPLTPERYAHFQSIMGKSVTSPEDFMKVVAGDEDIPRTLQSQIFAKQRSMQGKLQDTTKLNGALTTVRSMLNDAGIMSSRDKPDKAKTYDQFVGSFNDALQSEEEQTKKFPNETRQREIASKLIREMNPDRHFWNSPVRMFEQEVPAEDAVKIKAALEAAGKPTDLDMIRRVYVHRTYRATR